MSAGGWDRKMITWIRNPNDMNSADTNSNAKPTDSSSGEKNSNLLMKMAGVFMISTSTLILRTGIAPRWMSYLGFALAIFLLLSLGLVYRAPLVFPLYVLMIGVYVLIANCLRREK